MRRPGIYAAFWGHRCYVGMSGDLARRIGASSHLANPRHPDRIVGIVDRHDGLTLAAARVAERILAMHVAFTPGLQLLNAIPDGDVIDETSYGWIRLFIGEAALALRQAGLVFAAGSSRNVLAGPRTETGRLGPLRMHDLPAGSVYELNTCGVTAWAVENGADWTLLAGSEIRAEVMPSATSRASVLRNEWMYSGILIRSGGVLKLMRDTRFSSGSAVAHFVTGSKAIGRSGWKPIAGDEPTPEPAV